MSETKIVSLKDRQNRIYASIVPTNDGKWMEIKYDYKFRSNKRIFASEEEWFKKLDHAFRYICCEVVRNEREPYVPIEEQWRKNPLDPSLKDCAYLKAIQEKYRIRKKDPSKKYNLMDKAKDIKLNIAWLKYQLEIYLKNPSPEVNLSNIQTILALKNEEYEKIQMEMEEKIFQDEYENLTRKTTLAYIQQENTFVGVGFDAERERIVLDGRWGTTFHDLNLPERPDLWIWKKNKLIRVC